MKILFITTYFNSMSQRAWVELDRLNHQVKVHIASSQNEMTEAVEDFQPDLIIAPYLKVAIPDAVWKKFACLIVHPGILGDRGSCSLDWAILNNENEWGVTILQASDKMDAGPVWETVNFPMRNVSKSCLYRHEVTEAAMVALMKAVRRFEEQNLIPKTPEEINLVMKGKWRRATNENDFRFSWNEESSVIIRIINAADSYPGALCTIAGDEYSCYGAAEEEMLQGEPGQIIRKRHQAICVGCKDGAVWIQCLKKNQKDSIKLPAVTCLGIKANDIVDFPDNVFDENLSRKTFREIRYREANNVGYLSFDFYNGAMSTEQCIRLHQAFVSAKQRDTKVIVMMGGEDFWSNGIHLNLIEASGDPAMTSWENILAMDDLIHEIICTGSHYIISAMQGNAGAGGVALALAADKVVARKGIVFNPHTRNMGLYGSEYWTYLLPKRIGSQRAALFTEQCLPWGTDIALEVKLTDACCGSVAEAFRGEVKTIAEEVARLAYFPQLIKAKNFKRNRDESHKPLGRYREEELEKMRKNIFEDDWGYDYKRYCFVHKINPVHKHFSGDEKIQSVSGKDLFSERRKIWRRRKYEKLFYEV